MYFSYFALSWNKLFCNLSKFDFFLGNLNPVCHAIIILFIGLLFVGENGCLWECYSEESLSPKWRCSYGCRLWNWNSQVRYIHP